MAVVNPYEVEGSIDYDRLIKEFGIKKLTKSDLERIKSKNGELKFFWILDTQTKVCMSGNVLDLLMLASVY